MSAANLIVGIGSPHGDDRAGWLLIDALRRQNLAGARAISVADGSELLGQLGDCGRLIVVDACRTGAPPGTVMRLEWPDKRLTGRHSHSTHGFDLASALKMTEVLGKLPEHVVVFCVESHTSVPGTDPSPPVQRALPELERQVLEEIGLRENVTTEHTNQ